MDIQRDKLRDIFEEPLFSEQFDLLGVSHRQRDAILESVCFVLARAPELLPVVPGTCLSAITVSVYNRAPAVRVLFTYTEERVTLVAIDFATDAASA